MKTLKTTREVIDALGGTDSIAMAMDASRQTVSNWRVRNRFPANTYVEFRFLLAAKGTICADGDLWPMERYGRRYNRQRKKK